jgi:long-chain acyl-CoA synthetase
MFVVLGQTPARSDVDLSTLRVAFSSSAPLLAADVARFRDRYGVIVRQLYGSTETGTISFDREERRSPGSVGTPLPGIRVDVVDDQGRPLPAAEEGELVVTSPFAATGYLGNAAATAESFRDGRYFTGDLGRRDAAGAVIITGRKKLLINRGGFKVNPYEVEEAIRTHPKVREVAVVGAPGPHGDEVVRAVIVAREPCTAEEILAHCGGLIADFKIPARIDFVDALPTSPTGKILRADLKS